MSKKDIDLRDAPAAIDPKSAGLPEAYVQWLQTNYKTLHDALWEGHKVFWTTTSLFVPIIATATGYLVNKQATHEVGLHTIVLDILVITVAWIWYGMFLLVRHYNIFRLKRLCSLEETLNKHYDPTGTLEGFHCYSRNRDGRQQYDTPISLKWVFLLLPVSVTTIMLILIGMTLSSM